MECDHPEFEAWVHVSRLTDYEAGPVTGYSADVKVRCKKCETPFRFLGLPAGTSATFPTVRFGGDELRAPLEPSPDSPRWELPLAIRGTA